MRFDAVVWVVSTVTHDPIFTTQQIIADSARFCLRHIIKTIYFPKLFLRYGDRDLSLIASLAFSSFSLLFLLSFSRTLSFSPLCFISSLSALSFLSDLCSLLFPLSSLYSALSTLLSLLSSLYSPLSPLLSLLSSLLYLLFSSISLLSLWTGLFAHVSSFLSSGWPWSREPRLSHCAALWPNLFTLHSR